MAKVYTSRSEESTIDNVLRKGFCVPGSKRTVLRLALALSLKQPIPPGEEFDQLPGGREGGKEYGLDVLTGESQKESEAFVDAFRALLSVYHQQDLFGDDVSFVRYLQRHIHRGLREVQTSWRDSHHFHEFLFQEFFATHEAYHVAAPPEGMPLAQALAELGLLAEIVTSQSGPRVTRYTVQLAAAEDCSRIERKLDDLAFSWVSARRASFSNQPANRRPSGLTCRVRRRSGRRLVAS